ncbi:secondary thiamine-phosphate synthase enzyme [Desulforamulus putei DSM 12395]|uniref:Secondary thiamine-phosphate synthase enzyme n=1 Tax=Desulforamulus putei DSM 12395 TaxID=1121429 RepID=A0A1M4SE48_9FIRM|nr:secondary thiamine-phosphate synthase enzyme YjbQ [Desulforamulus putei]SHE30445.1 secondary thiamine-phosphate synthase enzyme [Desulforamulus putei DSM 12395]
MIFLKELRVKTNNRLAFIDISGPVSQAVAETGVREGSVLIFIPHTTAAVTLNENADPDVIEDIKEIIRQLVPREGPYRHREGNTAAHMMASLMGSSQRIIIHQGKLLLGTWQGIYLAEFDGPRERRVILQVQGDG